MAAARVSEDVAFEASSRHSLSVVRALEYLVKALAPGLWREHIDECASTSAATDVSNASFKPSLFGIMVRKIPYDHARLKRRSVDGFTVLKNPFKRTPTWLVGSMSMKSGV